MNPNPLGFNDPQAPLRRLSFKNSQGRTQQRQCVFDTLRVWTQDPYPMVTCWWVYADIREVEIERDENPLLFLRGAKHSWIGVASQLLSEHGMDIMTGLLKQDRSITGKILVEFESGRHPTRLGRDRNDTFSR